MEKTIPTLEIRIREARPKDFPRIKEISRKAFSHKSMTDIEHKSMDLQIGQYFVNIEKYDIWGMEKSFKNKVFLSQKFYVAEDLEGKIFGYTGIERLNTDGDAKGAFWINWTAVDPAYQGKCIGKKIVAELIKQVKKLGGLTLNVKTNPFLHTAHKTYEKLGFKQTGRIPNYFEKGCDLIIYSLDLTSASLRRYKKLLK